MANLDLGTWLVGFMQMIYSPDLLIFSQFHRHILKSRTMLLPTNSILAPGKIRVGLKKKTTKNKLLIFNIISPGEG